MDKKKKLNRRIYDETKRLFKNISNIELQSLFEEIQKELLNTQSEKEKTELVSMLLAIQVILGCKDN